MSAGAAAAIVFGVMWAVANIQLYRALKANDAERLRWETERLRLTAAAIQPSNPVGAARLQRQTSTEPVAPRPTPIGL